MSCKLLMVNIFLISLISFIDMAPVSCKPGQYTVMKPDGTFICIYCPDCGHGSGNIIKCDTVIHPDPNTTLDCAPCILGETYSPENSKRQCLPCKTCHHNEVVVGKCTLTNDTTICSGTCAKGYYWSNNSTDPCQKSTTSSTTSSQPPTTTSKQPGANPNANNEMDVGHLIWIMVVVVLVFVAVLLVISCVVYWLKRVRPNQSDDEVRRTVENNNQNLTQFERLPGASLSLSGRSTSSVREEDEQDEPDVPSSSEQSTPGAEMMEVVRELITTIEKLPVDVYDKICRLLNFPLSGKDWRGMVGKMLYSTDKMRIFKASENPTDAALLDWGTERGNNLYRLVEILTELGRADVVDIIKAAM